MKHGFLSDYFSGIGAKRLSDVEIRPDVSNQHEFNGIAEFKEIFGSDKINFKTTFLYLHDDTENIIVDHGQMTWYDARENHETRTEYRLYYSTNNVLNQASRGDVVVICRRAKDELFIIVTPEGSTSERQVLWLFGLNEVENKFIIKNLSEEKTKIGFAGKYILSELGIEIRESAQSFLDALVNKFGSGFPKTAEFSEYTRSTIKEISPIDDPDNALLTWLEQEELLFRALEKHNIKDVIKRGFGEDGDDVDAFISFSLSVQNRRKSRAGRAFENHLAMLFDYNNIKYSKGQKTERNNKPDFLFPGIKYYKDSDFNSLYLTMLGVKTTAKDRWRQVLTEADRIKQKHLITLQPAISKNQTDEMKSQNLQLVVPAGIMDSYTKEQKLELITVSSFIKLVKEKELASFK
jgi:hypothetical protein